METVTLRRGRMPRVEQGHPWVYRTEIARHSGAPVPGEVVRVETAGGRTIGHGYYNPQSMISVRLLTRHPEGPPEPGFWEGRLFAALRRRELLFPGQRAYRMANAEGDGLPGLVVDRFDEFLVVESLALGVERQLPQIVQALERLVSPRGIFLRADAPVRRLEGLDAKSRVLHGEAPPDSVMIEEDGIVFLTDLWGGQKTGHFFDQRLNRGRIRGIARGKHVLDMFCHTGGFALAAALGGAADVLAVDSSAPALERVKANARANGVQDRVQTLEGNAFDILRQFDREGRPFDLVVLDPPAFAKNRKVLEGALRGYKEVNLRAMRLLPAGGRLATASCSQPVGRDLFLDMLHEAAADTHRLAMLLELAGPAPDHPALLAAPETDYLTFALLELLDPPRPFTHLLPSQESAASMMVKKGQ